MSIFENLPTKKKKLYYDKYNDNDIRLVEDYQWFDNALQSFFFNISKLTDIKIIKKIINPYDFERIINICRYLIQYELLKSGFDTSVNDNELIDDLISRGYKEYKKLYSSYLIDKIGQFGRYNYKNYILI